MSNKKKSGPVSQHDECNILKRVNREFESLLDLNLQLADLHELDKIIDAAAKAVSSRLKKEEGMICWLDRDEKRISGSFWLAGKAPESFSTSLDKEGNLIDEAGISRLGNGLKGFIESLYESFSGTGTYKGDRYRQYFVTPFRHDGKTCGEIVILEADDTDAAYGGEEIQKIYDYLAAILKGAFARVRLAEQMLETEAIARKSTAEKEKMEHEIIRAQKLESLGLLAEGIAHDFNNILYIILGNTELAIHEIPEYNPAVSKLEKIKVSCLRGRDIVKQLLNFGRETDQKLIPMDAISAVREDSRFLKSAMPATIEFQFDLPDDKIPIMADQVQFNQVLMNICTNAAQAMEETGGIIKISAKKINIAGKECEKYPGIKEGEHLCITIQDTGPGIDPENMDKIFDPYFTTKTFGMGSGMGLAVVHGIVKHHRGSIAAENLPGQGAAFHIVFPVIDEHPEPS